VSDVGHPAPDDLFSDNHRWGDLEEWNRTALSLHSRGGVHRIERRGFTPFWAVIDHAGVLEVERQPELFTNSPEPVLQQSQAINSRQTAIKSLIHMDGAEHRDYRRLTSDWFKPAGIRRLTKRLDELSRGAVASMVEAGGECDFVADVAVPYPLRVILEVLGLPEQDYDRMLALLT